MKAMVALDKKGVAIPLTATLVVQALGSMAAVTVPIFAPTAAKDIGISATSVGNYVGLIYISSMISSLWSGDFIGRYGALRVFQRAMQNSDITFFLPDGIQTALKKIETFPGWRPVE